VKAFPHADDLQCRTQSVRKMLGNARDQRVGVSHVHHHRTENVAIVDECARLAQGDTSALP
jgi:hypothetical protein